MRVLIVHNRYRTPGGEERHIDLLEHWLPGAGVEVERYEVASPQEASQLDRLRLGATLTYRPAGAKLLREVLAHARPDIVHFHNILPLFTPAAIREAQRSGSRVVLTAHNYRFACPAGTLVRNGRIHEDCVDGSSLLCGLRNSRNAWTESLAYGVALELQRRFRLLHRWVDAYIAPTRFMAKMIARAGYPLDRIHTISHGTPLAPLSTSTGNFALYAGRLSEEKGIETLLSACRLVPDVPVVIAGDGPLKSSVERAANASVSYVGLVDPPGVAQLRAESRFAIAPSSCYEGQPFGILESLASGRAVVASRLGGATEIIEDGITGILVPPSDPPALAAAMRVLSNDERSTTLMGQNARRYAQLHLSPATQAKRVADLYEETMRMPRL